MLGPGVEKLALSPPHPQMLPALSPGNISSGLGCFSSNLKAVCFLISEFENYCVRLVIFRRFNTSKNFVWWCWNFSIWIHRLLKFLPIRRNQTANRRNKFPFFPFRFFPLSGENKLNFFELQKIPTKKNPSQNLTSASRNIQMVDTCLQPASLSHQSSGLSPTSSEDSLGFHQPFLI